MEMWNELIEGWVSQGKIPGAVLDIRFGDAWRYSRAYGRLAPNTSSNNESSHAIDRPAKLSTLFDAASLTKVVATLPAALLLAQQRELRLDDEVSRYIPEFRHGGVTLRHCLQHTSGLPADMPGYLDRYTALDPLQDALAQDLISVPGDRALYSDVGMILLGVVIARVAAQPLDAFVKQNVFEPLGMMDSTFNPPAELRNRIAATEWDGRRYLQGEVHDEKAYRLGGVSGSAGLFTTAGDLSRYADSWLYPERYNLLDPEWIDEAVSRAIQGRGLGWQVWQQGGDEMACGKLMPEGTYGHTGFTGGSLWLEPKRGLSVVFLTNAVHYGRNNLIRELRPELHNAIFAHFYMS
ncbi:hypothetical protein PSTEL_06730 [Paenibacillus stellifer]|uniref:Beta-lactamase-related domain-containing protein n=1 Tax=Paenibacillus stellifer TaxID=169760 RepID=A0A089LMS9_9BACL|nr:serine hydrolase [Paenibacillus stellifer]AIQ62846.1 hypothetical protein PSTEL_06730 [Paenibacillus stellifer]